MRFFSAPVLAALLVGCAEPNGSADSPNVVIVTLESIRTDVVGAYGGESASRLEVPITPEVDDFAAGATLYENAFSVTSWTLAAHASLFTGLYPTAHQTEGPSDRLDDSYPTLAEVLARRGFATAGIVSGPYLRRIHGLSQGFEEWEDGIAEVLHSTAHDDVTNPQMLSALERWLDARDPEQPFLLFAYFWDPHFDFQPPPPYDEMFVPPGAEAMDASSFDSNPAIHPYMSSERLDWIRAQYEGEVRWTDAHLGRLFAALRSRGLWDDTLIVVTSDHGEEFFDHGEKGHKKNLYAETVRVPLLVKYPDQRAGVRDARIASLVDVVPTVLDVMGLVPDFPVQGYSLLGKPEPARTVFFELLTADYDQARPGGEPVPGRFERWRAAQDAGHKLIRRGRSGDSSTQELYVTGIDPGETDDRIESLPESASRLETRLGVHLDESAEIASQYERGGTVELGPEELERLRALGYLGS